jgi:hypothetical protein
MFPAVYAENPAFQFNHAYFDHASPDPRFSVARLLFEWNNSANGRMLIA